MVALHAAALDPRITQLVAQNTLVSYQMALDAGLHKNLSEVAIPSVLLRYDVGDLVITINPRRVSFVNPVNAMGLAVPQRLVTEELSNAFESDGKLQTPSAFAFLSADFAIRFQSTKQRGIPLKKGPSKKSSNVLLDDCVSSSIGSAVILTASDNTYYVEMGFASETTLAS